MAVVLTATSTSAPTVAAVRRFQADARRRPGTGERVQGIYIAVIVALIVATLVYNAAHSALAQVVNPVEVARWGPSLMLLAALAAGYWGAVQGPVVFSVADLGHLIVGSPLPRRALVGSPLIRALAGAALGGAVVAGVVVVGLTGRGHHVSGTRALDLVIGVALMGILAATVAFAVSINGRCERVLRALTPPVALAAAGLAVVAALTGSTGRAIALWSGPWGWAVQAGAGSRTGWCAAATAALGAVVTVSILLAWRRRGSGETERYLRRSQGHARLQASMTDLNARTALRDLNAVAGRRRRRRSVSLRWLRGRLARPRRDSAPAAGGVAAVLWRDVVAGAERPTALVQMIAAGAAGTALALLDAGRVLGVAGGGVLLYVAATRVLEPLRIEHDAPGRSRVFLAARPGRAYVAHAVLPAVLSGVVAAVTAAVLGICGALAGHGAAAAFVVVLGAPAITVCAAMSARRGGRIPQEVLMTAMSTDPSGGGLVLLGWLVMWPALAAGLLALPLGAATAAHHASPAWVVTEVAVTAALLVALGRD